MVENNTWVDHEEDPEVKAIDKELEEKSRRKVKVWSVLRDRKRLIEAGLDPGPEDQDLSSSESDKSSSDDEVDADPKAIDDSRESSSVPPKKVDEEYDHLILMMTKKDKLYVMFSLGNEMTDWEGLFDINSPVEELRKLAEIVHPVKQQQGNESSTNSEVGGLSPRKIGLSQLLDSERKRQKRESSQTGSGSVNDTLIPKFNLGQRVYYFINEDGNMKWHSCRVIGYNFPQKWSSHFDEKRSSENEIRYRLLPDREEGQEYEVTYRNESKLRAWSWAKPCYMTSDRPTPLLPLDLVGIDTCSALSVSSRREDFLWLETTKRAKRSVILRGVGGDSAQIGGRGPMVVQGKDEDGNDVLLFDPKGVYLESNREQADFRIFGQQRMKSFGFYLVQRDVSEGGDRLVHQNGKILPLITNGGILAMKSFPLTLSTEQLEHVTAKIESALKVEDGLHYCIQLSSSLLMNEAHLTDEEAERLLHWRVGHRALGKSKLNETCPVCIEGKKKTGTFKRNYEFCGSTQGEPQPYWRLYVDGYGGQ
jgi:hypothetical protein